MRVCFVHQYFPGQFARLARHFVEQGHEVVAFHRGIADGRSSTPVEGVRVVEFGQELPPPEEGILAGNTRFILEAASMASAAEELGATGWQPDLVYSHTGWGSAAFLHDVFPGAKFIKYCEWYYNNSARSTEFLEDGARPLPKRMATSTLNFPVLADLAHGHAFISPTEWQKSQFPPTIRDRIEVIPDGIDLDFFEPDPDARVTLLDGRMVDRKDRIVTYVARGADPFRGFAPFLRALAVLQSRDPSVEAIVLGDRKVYYGIGGGTEDHFDAVMAEVGIDPARTHFLGKLSYEDYRTVLHVSSAHVYLTVPFVLSWSCLEAMAAGCAIVGSDTMPVREFITHGKNGRLAGFFDPEGIADRIEKVLAGGPKVERMRENARRTIRKRWSAKAAIDGHMALARRLLRNR